MPSATERPSDWAPAEGPDETRAKQGEVTKARGALDAYLQSIGAFIRAKEQVVCLLWPRVVGEWCAQRTAVTRVARRTVYVWCDSSALAHQLSQEAERLVAELNQHLGGPVLGELRCSTTGRPPAPRWASRGGPPRPSHEQLAATRLPREETAMVDLMCGIVGERPVGEAFRRALVSARRAARWRLEHGYQECPRCGAPSWGSDSACVVCRGK